MPIPEDILVYGRNDLLRAVAHAQPQPTAGQPAFNANNRQVTRSITFHYSHGWWYRMWRLSGNNWFGTTFNIDLDGTLFQCQEMSVRTLHVGGTPHFTGAYAFVNNTCIGVEVCRFGSFSQNGVNYQAGNYAIDFIVAAEPANGICNYSPGSHPAGGTLQFNLRKMRGGTLVNTPNVWGRSWYYAKLHRFDDPRNPRGNTATGGAAALFDALYTEEQQQTMILWAKAMCEMHRIPKRFFIDPNGGRQNPWIRDIDLVGQPGAPGSAQRRLHNENSERAKYHQGILGHVNVQSNRRDPGPSIDYYRILRGISDEWWLPVDTGGAPRALDYLDAARVADYMRLTHYRDESDRQRLFAQVESGAVGFYPFGENRVWHGGIHITGAGPVYAMANGVVVCARVTNGTFNMSSALPGATVSRCFVLMRHDVHVLNQTNVASPHWDGTHTLIDYRANYTRVLYTLYMHLEPYVDQPGANPPPGGGRTIARDAQGRYATDWDNLPWWLNRYIVDNPNDPNVVNGNLIFPNERIELSDVVGWRGTYITGKGSGGVPTFGLTTHVELFTTEDPQNFPDSPWTAAHNRIEDPNNDVICDINLVDSLIMDADGDGLEASDIRDCLPTLRDKAVKFRSEWSLTNKQQLGSRLVSWWGLVTRDLGEVMDDATFNSDVLPLMFHSDMVVGGAASDIGPFHGQTKVWHLHPLTFMRWMNDRVSAHERVLGNQNKRRTPERSNLRIRDDYVIGWENLGGAAPTTLARNTGQVYPEAAHGGNTYEARVNAVADQAALMAAAQTRTRFHLRLMDYIDHMTDRPHSVVVTRAWETNPITAALTVHGQGNAVLVTPASGTGMDDWFLLVRHTQISLNALNESYPEYRMTWRFTNQAGETPANVQATGADMTARIRAAANAVDPVLTAAPAISAATLAAIRLQVQVNSAERQITVRFTRLEVIDDGHVVGGAEWSVAFRAEGEMVCFLSQRRVSTGQTITLPSASSTREFVLDSALRVLNLTTDGTDIGFWRNTPLARAATRVNLSTVTTTVRAVNFAPASGAYRVHAEIFES
jgi:hypothetical protein